MSFVIPLFGSHENDYKYAVQLFTRANVSVCYWQKVPSETYKMRFYMVIDGRLHELDIAVNVKSRGVDK